MQKTLTGKILAKHLVEGELQYGKTIRLKIDQTLTQDTTGTMAYMQAEALGIEKVQTELSVSYIDHNTLGEDFKNPDDHAYLQSIANRLGVYLSKAGNGICHQVHLERFARPGRTLLGSDSHTPHAGGLGSLAFGSGGLDVALAMGGQPYEITMPRIMGVFLTGELPSWVTAKDIILEILKRLTVKGGLGKILEYNGPGIKHLSVSERATICNMGAETGATTSIFPSDERTLDYLTHMERESEWEELKADSDVVYEEFIEINLSKLVPLIAKPHSPDNVSPVKECEDILVNQVSIGSCSNSSFEDLAFAAQLLRGKKIHEKVSLTISPGSMSVYFKLAEHGHLQDFMSAGARILESSCGPCTGQSVIPESDSVSVRTFSRNFEGRAGNKSCQIYLSSVPTAIACALTGKITDPRVLGVPPTFEIPSHLRMKEALIINPNLSESKRHQAPIHPHPELCPLDPQTLLHNRLEGEVLLKLEDDITTDQIMPVGEYLELRSHVSEYARHCFEPLDPTFFERVNKKQGGFIVAGHNYGQGSSREHAALCPRFLGIKAIFAKSFARIHMANLINFGVIPLTFKNWEDAKLIEQGDQLSLDVSTFVTEYLLINNSKQISIPLEYSFNEQSFNILKSGGLLSYTRKNNPKLNGCCIKD